MPGVVGRFAPTPSGRMHAGNVFSALMAWLSVRSQGGTMVLRIEDLDPRAQDPSHAELLMSDLSWLGLDWDVGPLFQSQRTTLYDAAIERLHDLGLTYPCFCTRAELHAASAPHASDGTYIYPGTCRHLTQRQVREKSQTRRPAIRLRVPGEDDPQGKITVHDRVYGTFSEVLAHDCGDFLVRRSDGIAAYQLAVVVDDALMGITEVVRGHDLLGSTPRQLYLQGLLGYERPAYAHVPLLLAPDGRRLSKRDRDLDLGQMRAAGVRPEQLLGALASLVGLAERGEDVSTQELVERFSWESVRSHANDIVVGSEFLDDLAL